MNSQDNEDNYNDNGSDSDEEDYDDEYEYEFEEEDFVATSGVAVDDDVSAAVQASLQEQWTEPTNALAMKINDTAKKETSGSKQRLLRDLFNIMNGNESSQNPMYALEPTNEDDMSTWTLKFLKFDADSDLQKDMLVLGVPYIHLEMSFPDQYPFEPPFCKVVRPRFYPMTGYVNTGALCAELLTPQGWNPINDITSVIVSIQALLLEGKGRLHAAYELWQHDPAKYNRTLEAALQTKTKSSHNKAADDNVWKSLDSYRAGEAEAGYARITSFHSKNGYDDNYGGAKKG